MVGQSNAFLALRHEPPLDRSGSGNPLLLSAPTWRAGVLLLFRLPKFRRSQSFRRQTHQRGAVYCRRASVKISFARSLNRDAEPDGLGATGAINDEGRLFGASPIEQAIGRLAASLRRAMA